MMRWLRIVLVMLVALFLLAPRVTEIDDGGSVVYKTPLYCVTRYHMLDPHTPGEYIEGLGIEIFGIEVYCSEEVEAAFQ